VREAHHYGLMINRRGRRFVDRGGTRPLALRQFVGRFLAEPVQGLGTVRQQGDAPARAALFAFEADCCRVGTKQELLAQLDIDDKEQALKTG